MRRRKAEKREVLEDPKYKSKLIAEFINSVMLSGKKSVAERIVYGALDIVKERTNEADVLKAFHKILENARPRIEVKPRRVGGATYQVPIEVKHERGNSLAMRWIRDLARSRKGKPMQEKIAEELILAFKGEGGAIKKRDDTHKMADANKAFAHFRW